MLHVAAAQLDDIRILRHQRQMLDSQRLGDH
jgi:hypothetical protein